MHCLVFLGLGIILTSSHVALIKYPGKNSLGDKGLILAQSSVLWSMIAWKSQEQELEGVDKNHLHSVAGKN